MKKIILLFALTVIYGFVVQATSSTPTVPPPDRIEVQGHRGARGLRPENTLPAFRFALEKGVDVLELDVAVTKDDVAVISHDPHLSPEICVGADGKKPDRDRLAIRDLTWKDLQGFDCGRLKHPRFPDQITVPGAAIPRLKDLFAFVKASKLPAAAKVEFNIETKIFPAHPELTPPPDTFVRLIVDAAREAGMLDRVRLQSFDDRTLLAAYKIAPQLRTVLLLSDNHVDMVAVARAAFATTVSPNEDWVLPEDVKSLHAAKIKVIPWTANSAASWERLVAMGVDGIITDYPDRLIEWLKQRPVPAK